MNPEKAELVRIRIANAKATLREVEVYQIENELWNTAVNRLYYACLYAVTALLHNHGYDTKTHSGVQNNFGHYFIKTGIFSKETGKFFAKLFKMRQNADYEDLLIYEKEEVLPLIPQARELISQVCLILEVEDERTRYGA